MSRAPIRPSLANLEVQLERCIGYDRTLEIRAALDLCVADSPVILVGPRGCDQHRLALAIHRASRRARREFRVLDRSPVGTVDSVLGVARRGTVFVDLCAFAPQISRKVPLLPPAFAHALFGWSGGFRVRSILAVPSLRELRPIIGVLSEAPHVQVLPLAARPHDAPRLVHELLAESGCERRVLELGAQHVAGLARGRWRHNIDTIRESIPVLAAFLTTRSVWKAAAVLGMAKSTVHDRLRIVFGLRGLRE